MNTITLRMHEVRKLKELPLEHGVFNTEALMLILPKTKCKNKQESQVFKYLDCQDDEKQMARKMYTVNMLNSSEKYKEIKELVIPDSIVIVDGKLTGFACPLIPKHRNLGMILLNDKIPLKEKLSYLKQLGTIIDNVQRVEEESFKMYFGDLNEFNFILDKGNHLRAIDLDSAYIGQDLPCNEAYYLLKNKYLHKVKEKYHINSQNIVIPNEESDLYCYNMIILDTIAKTSMFKKNIDVYYEYLNYLDGIGVSKNLLDIFSDIYLPKKNSNPKEYIEELDPKLGRKLEYKVFQKNINQKET